MSGGEAPRFGALDAETWRILELAAALWVRADGRHDEAKAVMSLFYQFYLAVHRALRSLVFFLREEHLGADEIAPMFRTEFELLRETPAPRLARRRGEHR